MTLQEEYRKKPMHERIEHPYAQVVCRNRGELLYVLEWAKEHGKHVSEYQWEVETFPYHLFLEGNLVGWTDLTDRIGDKISFFEFAQQIEWQHKITNL